ncbi:nucleophile aminohydrolase [Lactarius quietus]|nr:nucleophile aminohydrolase [Lactarius quietus]
MSKKSSTLAAPLSPATSDSNHRRSLRTAISSALTTLTTGSSSESSLGFFNAGYSSNLTDGCYAFGGVGAVRGVRNPVLLARSVLDARRQQSQSKVGLGLGRVPPLMLVGEGAVRFAAERGVVQEPTELVAPRARREWERRTSVAGDSKDFGIADADADADLEMLRARQDTVGAVVVQGDAGDVAAGVSSGGLLLKPSGRVGEAAVFGAGCWAERLTDGRSIGELIMQSSIAKTLAERIAAAEGDTHDVLRSVLVDHFYMESTGEHQPAVGVLLLTRGVDGDESTTRLWCAFTTQSMAVAYSSSQHPKPKVNTASSSMKQPR